MWYNRAIMVKGRIKGDGFEFKIQKQMHEMIEDLGLTCRFSRNGMSGQLEGKKGDFTWKLHFKKLQGEAKKGKSVPKTLYKWLEKDNSDFLVVARDHKPTLFVIPMEHIEHLLTCQENYAEKIQEELEI